MIRFLPLPMLLLSCLGASAQGGLTSAINPNSEAETKVAAKIQQQLADYHDHRVEQAYQGARDGFESRIPTEVVDLPDDPVYVRSLPGGGHPLSTVRVNSRQNAGGPLQEGLVVSVVRLGNEPPGWTAILYQKPGVHGFAYTDGWKTGYVPSRFLALKPKWTAEQRDAALAALKAEEASLRPKRKTARLKLDTFRKRLTRGEVAVELGYTEDGWDPADDYGEGVVVVRLHFAPGGKELEKVRGKERVDVLFVFDAENKYIDLMDTEE